MHAESYGFTEVGGQHALKAGHLTAAERRTAIERAVKAACADVSSPARRTEACRANYRSRLQGEIAERAMKSLGGESLNESCGRNFPVYDHKWGQEWASVKTHMPGKAHPSAHLDNYAHDLRVAMGETEAKEGKYKGWRGPTFAARAVAHQEGASHPAQRAQAVRQQMEQHATIRIPRDHVEEVRRCIWYAAQRQPYLYGLPSGYDRSDLQGLVDRVKPLPISAREIQDAVERQMKALGG